MALNVVHSTDENWHKPRLTPVVFAADVHKPACISVYANCHSDCIITHRPLSSSASEYTASSNEFSPSLCLNTSLVYYVDEYQITNRRRYTGAFLSATSSVDRINACWYRVESLKKQIEVMPRAISLWKLFMNPFSSREAQRIASQNDMQTWVEPRFLIRNTIYSVHEHWRCASLRNKSQKTAAADKSMCVTKLDRFPKFSLQLRLNDIIIVPILASIGSGSIAWRGVENGHSLNSLHLTQCTALPRVHVIQKSFLWENIINQIAKNLLASEVVACLWKFRKQCRPTLVFR